VEEYLRLAHRIVHRLSIPKDEHDEAFGVAVLAGVEALESFDSERGVPKVAYVSQRITWALKDWMRSENVRATVPLFDGSAIGGARVVSGSPERAAILSEEIDAVLAAIDALPERDRTIVLARALGYSVDEVCAALSITRDQARQYLRYARVTVRRSVEASPAAA
jgi:RNA polymerase sigma factor (sigma-70 family)